MTGCGLPNRSRAKSQATLMLTMWCQKVTFLRMALKRLASTAGILALCLTNVSWATPDRSFEAYQEETLNLLHSRIGQVPNAHQETLDMLQQRLQESGVIKEMQRPDVAQYDVQVLISASMPAATLRALFAQAKAYGPEKVRFVIRGFPRKRLGETIRTFRSYLADPNDDSVILDIDPTVFRAVDAKAVPIFLVREGEQWWEVHGEISLAGAVEYVKDRNNPLVAGPLYPIQEPDMISLIEEEGRKVPWEELEEHLARKAQDPKITTQVQLPEAAHTYTRQFTPQLAILEDILVPNPNTGQSIVLARKGQTVNPLQHTNFSNKILVIDATKPHQIDFAKKILEKHENVDIFFTGQDVKLSNVYAIFPNHMVFPLWQAYRDGFGVSHTPSLITQVQDHFVIKAFGRRDVAQCLDGEKSCDALF